MKSRMRARGGVWQDAREGVRAGYLAYCSPSFVIRTVPSRVLHASPGDPPHFQVAADLERDADAHLTQLAARGRGEDDRTVRPEDEFDGDPARTRIAVEARDPFSRLQHEDELGLGHEQGARPSFEVPRRANRAETLQRLRAGLRLVPSKGRKAQNRFRVGFRRRLRRRFGLRSPGSWRVHGRHVVGFGVRNPGLRCVHGRLRLRSRRLVRGLVRIPLGGGLGAWRLRRRCVRRHRCALDAGHPGRPRIRLCRRSARLCRRSARLCRRSACLCRRSVRLRRRSVRLCRRSACLCRRSVRLRRRSVRLCRRLATGGRLQSESRHRRMVDLAGVGQSDRALERSERAPCAPPHGAVDLARVVSSLDERLLDRLDLRVGRRLEHRARTGEHSQQHQRGQQLPRRWHRSRAPGRRWHRSRCRLRRTEDPAHVAELSRIVHCGTAAPVHARSRRPGAPRFSNLRSAHPPSHRAENIARGSGGASVTSRARRCACQRRSHSLNSHAMRKVRHR